jgi:hypothetical protein
VARRDCRHALGGECALALLPPAKDAAPIRDVVLAIAGVGLVDRAAKRIGRHGPPGNHALGAKHSDEHADGEGPTTETECVDVVAWCVILTQKKVELLHVTCQTVTDSTAEKSQGPEIRGTNPVVIKGDLSAAWGQVQRLVKAPDVGLEQFCCAVSCPVGQKNDVFAHAFPPGVILPSRHC